VDPVVVSETKQTFNGKSYYRRSARYFRQHANILHRDVWAYHHGPIPAGHHIHHIDGDRANNALSNLALMDPLAHMRHHLNAEDGSLRALLAAQEVWRETDEGKARMSEVGKRVAHFMRQPKTFTCAHCETEFQTTTSFARFCSNRCKQRWRLKNGPRAVEYTCTVCGKPYIGDRYAPSVSCSRKCRGTIIQQSRRSNAAKMVCT
jgi:hypothetical protein